MGDFSVPGQRRASLATNVPLVLIAALLAGFSAYSLVNLDTSSLWLDELWSLLYADPDKSVSFLFGQYWVQDASPPLYPFLLHHWLWLLSSSESMLRLLSWLFAVGAAIVAYALGRNLYRGPVAFVLAACLFLTPGLTQYALEARHYSLLLMLTTALVLLGIMLCERAHAEHKLDSNGLLIFVFVGMLASFTHYFGVFVYALLGIYLYVTALRQRADAGRVLLYGISSAAIYSIWLVMNLQFVQIRMQYRGSIDSGLSAEWFGSRLSDGLDLGFGDAWLVLAIALVIMLAAARSGKAYLASHRFLLPLTGIIGICAISWMVTPYTNVSIPRYYLVLIPLILVMAVTALDTLAPPKVFPWIGALLCCVFAYYAFDRVTLIKSEMREAGGFILAQPGCQSGHIFVAPDLAAGARFFRYYLPGDAVHLVTNRDEPFDEVAKMVMTQECKVAMWLMHPWWKPHQHFISEFGIDPDRLTAHQFVGTTVYTRK